MILNLNYSQKIFLQIKMGQYFYFFNSGGEINHKPLRHNFGLPWMKSLDRLDEDCQIQIFVEVIKDNNWDCEKCYAIGDNGTKLIYDTSNETVEITFESIIFT
jgi:hypothetical protein